MTTESSSKTQQSRSSQSPKPDRNILHHRAESEQPEFSSDETNEENRTHDDSYDGNAAEDSQNQESPRQRLSPKYRFNTAESNIDSTIKRSHRKSTGNYDSDGAEQPKTPKQHLRRNSIERCSSNMPLGKYLVWIIIPVIIGMIAVYFLYCTASISQTSAKEHLPVDPKKMEINKFKEAIREIKKTFPGQNRLTWSGIEAGIIDIINGSAKPWTFVLFSNQTKEISCLAKMLGKASSKALHSEDCLELKAEEMGDDYGLAIDRLEPEIKAKKAVVVYDVLEIDPRAIQAFHTMCDRETPLVKNAVYILTIITSGNIPEFEKPVVFVENQLTNRFINKVPEDKLQPLITRLMDGEIIPVKPEIGFTTCPL